MNEHFQISAGRSIHGTGDVRGLMFNGDYIKTFKNRFAYGGGFSGTIHDGNKPLFFTAPNGSLINSSIRYTTAGVQLNGIFAWNGIKNHDHELQLQAIVVLRYQSSSYYDDVTILYEPITGLPFPVIVFNHLTPQRTYAVGVGPRLSYNFTFGKNFSLGILASAQTDTGGDFISQLSIGVGKFF